MSNVPKHLKDLGEKVILLEKACSSGAHKLKESIVLVHENGKDYVAEVCYDQFTRLKSYARLPISEQKAAEIKNMAVENIKAYGKAFDTALTYRKLLESPTNSLILSTATMYCLHFNISSIEKII